MTAPAPYETSLLGDLRRVLQDIRIANGYHTDAGANVYTAAEKVDPQDELIFLIMDDAEEELRNQDGYVRDVTLRVDVQIFVAVGPRNRPGSAAPGADGRATCGAQSAA
jgi:hypothetical protein